MLEAVPNVSEGRDSTAIAAIREAFSSHAALLDVHSDHDHHRSVFTLAGSGADLTESLAAGAAAARDRIDLRTHDGVHPRVGAVDVVPLVPLEPGSMPEAKRVALAVAERLGELSLPVFLYGEIGGGRRPADIRRGGVEELARRMRGRELVPDRGPPVLDPRVGAALVGARTPLVAYNLDLATDDVRIARAVAAAVRESSGGLPGVQAIGLLLPRAGRIQVSLNVLDLESSPLHEVVARVTLEAERLGAAVAGGELVGLVPELVLRAAATAGASLPGVDESHVLERRIAAAL